MSTRHGPAFEAQRIESARRIPIPVQRQRRSVGAVQTMGLFDWLHPNCYHQPLAGLCGGDRKKLEQSSVLSGETASKRHQTNPKNVPTEFQKVFKKEKC
jgi:hypothetical protein